MDTNDARRLTVQEFLQQEGLTIDELLDAELFGDDHTPALCSEGCRVEPDGKCSHHHPSILLALGLI